MTFPKSSVTTRLKNNHYACVCALRLYTLHQGRAEQGKEQFPNAVYPVASAAYCPIALLKVHCTE